MTKAMKAGLIGALALVLAAATIAVASGSRFSMKARLTGYEEVPALSSPARGTFTATTDGDSLTYALTYSGFPTAVTQSHIHFGQKGVAAGVSIFLCTNLGNGPAGTPACPSPGGTVTRTVTAADVVGPAGQGIAPGEWAEVIAAIRAGVTYANVHTAQYGPGEIRGQISTGDDQGDQD
jgi:CHRD domain-containing protein